MHQQKTDGGTERTELVRLWLRPRRDFGKELLRPDGEASLWQQRRQRLLAGVGDVRVAGEVKTSEQVGEEQEDGRPGNIFSQTLPFACRGKSWSSNGVSIQAEDRRGCES